MPSLWQFDRRPLRFVLLALLLTVLVGLAVTALATIGGNGGGGWLTPVLAIAKPSAWMWG